jgi:hypothetical protein
VAKRGVTLVSPSHAKAFRLGFDHANGVRAHVDEWSGRALEAQAAKRAFDLGHTRSDPVEVLT